MRRERLRPAYSPEQMRQVYQRPHDHTQWADHRLRVACTVQVGRALAEGASSGADLSCGDGTILRSLDLAERYLGDLAPGYEFTGPIEETVWRLPPVHIYVCTETIEHLDDPDAVLVALRPKCRALLLSTPVDAWGDSNAEHYWAWDRPAVEAMLARAGFSPVMFVALDVRPGGGQYQFGIWGAK